MLSPKLRTAFALSLLLMGVIPILPPLMLALVKRLRRPRVRVSEATALGRRGTALLLGPRQGRSVGR
ncbi:hypothetical protein SE15_07200 [Thermanaerothrix daxensis]|uniref:Uncharacterized protein n=1 Tax=Thermanaerothrix daxensis TaxID=869279 RepID=A0A0P6XIP0_9CHLR|nr:hypothetical protein [Thermanaerothrix daxensis]KPL83068.1 hypothetical protein SE15_07200 [Thermanaerothrix daxensis]